MEVSPHLPCSAERDSVIDPELLENKPAKRLYMDALMQTEYFFSIQKIKILQCLISKRTPKTF